MMTRVSPLDTLNLSEFEAQPSAQKPKQERAVIAKMAEENGFPSRQPSKKVAAPPKPAAVAPRKKRRGVAKAKTEMDQISVKAPAKEGLKARFDRIADDMDKPLREVLALALDALERERKSVN